MRASTSALDVPGSLLDTLSRPSGRALMLGHVHPDADVLGTCDIGAVEYTPGVDP